MKAKLPPIFNRKKRAAEESDFGRRFGWFIEKDGEKIGELEYVRWIEDLQFWHEYRLTWCRPENAIIGPDAWISEKLVLRNRHFTDIVIEHFSTSPERDRLIAVRGAHVPEERF